MRSGSQYSLLFILPHAPFIQAHLKGGFNIVKKRIYASLAALALLAGSMLSATGLAQTKTTTKAKTVPAANELLASLPESDGVVSIDVQRLLNDLLPRFQENSPAKMAQLNERLDRIKARTGLDLRTVERIALGMRFTDKSSVKNFETVALARGSFNAPAVLSAGLLAAKDKYKYEEQKHAGKTIYVFSAEELFGKIEQPEIKIDEKSDKSGAIQNGINRVLNRMTNMPSGKVGVVALNANIIAFGEPAFVRATIDAGASGKGLVSPALTALALHNPNAIIGFGANVPANVSRYLEVEMDDMAKTLDSIRQLYGSVNSTNGGFEMQANARTEKAADAQNVYNQLIGLKDLGGFFVSNMSGDKGKLAQTALDNLKITKEGNDVQLRIALAQSDVAMLMRVF